MKSKKVAFALLAGVALVAGGATAPAPTPAAAGLLETSTLFTVYGRAFGVGPILGRLGTYKNFETMAADTRTWVKQIGVVNGNKRVVVGVHLIYALAMPCKEKGDCLLYLEGTEKHIVENYILPAARRGWVVVLDSQLGRSDPVTQVRRMIGKGYLKYENVHVALDPEFHSVPGHDTPGIPIGTIRAEQVNEVQRILDEYVRAEHLKTKKILIVHQFGDPAVHDGVPYMIQDKKNLKAYGNVELVIDADGLGTPTMKAHKYNLMTSDRTYPCIRFRGIKVFFPNPWEKRGHYDKPPMTVDEIFGVTPVFGKLRMEPKPNVVIIA